jgi:hypothetical protein
VNVNDHKPTSGFGPDEMARLHPQAEREHIAVHERVRSAVLQRIEDAERRERVLALTDAVLAEHAHALERLRER